MLLILFFSRIKICCNFTYYGGGPRGESQLWAVFLDIWSTDHLHQKSVRWIHVKMQILSTPFRPRPDRLWSIFQTKPPGDSYRTTDTGSGRESSSVENKTITPLSWGNDWCGALDKVEALTPLQGWVEHMTSCHSTQTWTEIYQGTASIRIKPGETKNSKYQWLKQSRLALPTCMKED